jgi:4-amino-4-deoxy-L-arabinose transferase-like glycosyltransferase
VIPHRVKRSSLWTLAGLVLILLLGGTLRGMYLHERAHEPDFRYPLVDAKFHHYWARGLATGDWTPPADEPNPRIQQLPFFRPPGYPYFLAGVFKLTGPGYLWPRIVQMALGLLSALLTYHLARKYIGLAAGLIAALLMATHWVFIFFEADFQEPVLSILLLLALLQLLMAWRARLPLQLSLGAGLLIGLMALMRPNALALLPATAIWTGWIHRRQRQGRWGTTWIALAAGTVIAISPATIRNGVVGRDFVLISSNGGLNLYIANRDGADGTVKASIPGIGKLDTCFDHPGIVVNVQRELGRPMRDSQVSDYFARQAGRWVLHHPLEALKLAGRRTLLFWGPLELDDNKPIHPERENSSVLRSIPTSFATILSLGLMGILVVGWDVRRNRTPRRDAALAAPATVDLVTLMVLLLAAWFASYLPFAVLSRYRTPIVPLWILLGALFLQRVGQFLSVRNFRRAGVGFGILLVALLLTHPNYAGYRPSQARWHYQRGLVRRQLRQMDPAIEEFRAAVRCNPRYVSALNDLGAALLGQHRIAEGLRYLQDAVRLDPESAAAQFNLAAALELSGDYEQSRDHYREALRLDPSDRAAQAGLQRVERSHRQADRSEPDLP